MRMRKKGRKSKIKSRRARRNTNATFPICQKQGNASVEANLLKAARQSLIPGSENRFNRAFLGLKKPMTRPGKINPSQFPALRCMKCYFPTFS